MLICLDQAETEAGEENRAGKSRERRRENEIVKAMDTWNSSSVTS